MTRTQGYLVAILSIVGLMGASALAQDAAVEPSRSVQAAGQIMDNLTMVLGIALAVSEGLALTDRYKANGIIHLFIMILKRMIGRQVSALLLIGAALTLTACGKTLDQIKQTAHDLIEIGGKVYEDVKEGLDAAKPSAPGSPAEKVERVPPKDQ